jgi:chromosome segregation ATPase
MDTNQLQLENEKLNARLDKAKEVFRQQAADIKAKDEAYLKLRDEYNEVVRERNIHLEANAKFNKQLLEAESLIAELKKTDNTNSETLQEELNIVKKELHIANERIADYDAKCTRYDEVIKSLNETNDELQGLATARLADINKSKEEIKKLDDTILEMNNQLSEISEKHHNLVFKYDELTTEHNLLNEQFADLENEYNNSEELRKSYFDATNKLNEEVSSLQDIIVSKDAAYKNLESTYNDAAVEHVRDVNALKHTIEQLKKDIEDKDAKLVDACAKVGTLTKQLETETGKVEEVKTKTEEAVTTIKKKLQALNDGLGDEFNIFG